MGAGAVGCYYGGMLARAGVPVQGQGIEAVLRALVKTLESKQIPKKFETQPP